MLAKRNYWSEEDDRGTNIVKSCMPRNDYLTIKKYIYILPTTRNKENKGLKERPLLNKNENLYKFKEGLPFGYRVVLDMLNGVLEPASAHVHIF